MSYYSDEVVTEAIEALDRDGDVWVTEDTVDRLTEVQWARYKAALDRVGTRAAVRLHREWWNGPRDMPLPPFGVWSWDTSDEIERFANGGS